MAADGKLLRKRELPAGNSCSEHRRAVQRLAGQRIHGRRPDEQPERGDPCDIRTVHRTGPNGDAVAEICVAQGIPEALVDTFQHTTTALPASTGGNQDLEPETADTITFGIVWQPEFGNNDLSVTVDYWDISIDDVIKTIDGPSVLQRCFNAAFNPTLDPANVFCQLISRQGATGTVNEVSTSFLNLASLETSGIDAQINHAVDIGPGQLQSSLAIGWLNNYEEQSLPGDPFLDYAGTIGGPANRVVDNDVHPEWKLTFMPSLRFWSGVDRRALALPEQHGCTPDGAGSHFHDAGRALRQLFRYFRVVRDYGKLALEGYGYQRPRRGPAGSQRPDRADPHRHLRRSGPHDTPSASRRHSRRRHYPAQGRHPTDRSARRRVAFCRYTCPRRAGVGLACQGATSSGISRAQRRPARKRKPARRSRPVRP